MPWTTKWPPISNSFCKPSLKSVKRSVGGSVFVAIGFEKIYQLALFEDKKTRIKTHRVGNGKSFELGKSDFVELQRMFSSERLDMFLKIIGRAASGLRNKDCKGRFLVDEAL